MYSTVKKYLMVSMAISALCVFFGSCDDYSDIFKGENTAPSVFIKTGDGSYKKEVLDSFRISAEDYSIVLKVRDDMEKSSLKVNFKFNNENVCSTALKDSTLVLSGYSNGLYDLDITVFDSYGLNAVANLKVFIYDNLPPVPHLTFKLLENGNYQLNATQSYDPEGEITNYHFDYGVKTVDWHEPIIEAYYKHIEDNGGVTLVLTDDKGAKSEPVFFELQQ